jgi:hypothetical protein
MPCIILNGSSQGLPELPGNADGGRSIRGAASPEKQRRRLSFVRARSRRWWSATRKQSARFFRPVEARSRTYAIKSAIFVAVRSITYSCDRYCPNGIFIVSELSTIEL